MTGCEMLHCPKFQEGKCTEEQEYTDPTTGNSCCSRRDGAIPVQPLAPDPLALLERCKPWLEGYRILKKRCGCNDCLEKAADLDALLSDIEKMEADNA